MVLFSVFAVHGIDSIIIVTLKTTTCGNKNDQLFTTPCEVKRQEHVWEGHNWWLNDLLEATVIVIVYNYDLYFIHKIRY